MKNLLRCTRVNVDIKDRDSNDLLYVGHNLFTNGGRGLIANFLIGSIALNPTYFVCDLGSGSATPMVSDTDLSTYISPLSIQVAANYPAAIAGQPTGVHFHFEYTNLGADKTVRELGLFYRPSSDTFPGRGTDPTNMMGTMLARLKTTLSSIVIGNNRTITIDWKILF